MGYFPEDLLRQVVKHTLHVFQCVLLPACALFFSLSLNALCNAGLKRVVELLKLNL